MKNIIIRSALLLLASSFAFAGLIQTSAEFGIQGSATTLDISDLNEALSVAGFDSSLDILNSKGSIENNVTDLARAALDILLSED